MTIIRYAFCLFSFFLANFSLAAQNLDRKVFIIQSNGAKAEGRVIDADYNNLGKNGAKIQLRDNEGTSHQAWKFEASGDGLNKYYIVISKL